MELNDLKAGWQHAGGATKSETELQQMTRVKNHPVLKKIRIKLVIEILLMSFFLCIYYDWFDGNRKPLMVNILLAGSVVLIILNDSIGFISISKPIVATNLKTGVQQCLKRIKRLSVLSLALSFLYSLALLTFFSASITYAMKKYLILAICICILLLSTYFSYKIWLNWIGNLKKLSLEMEDDL